MWYIIGGVVFVLFVYLALYALCREGGKADEMMEKAEQYREKDYEEKAQKH